MHLNLFLRKTNWMRNGKIKFWTRFMYASQIHFLTSGIWKFLVCSPVHWPSATKNEKKGNVLLDIFYVFQLNQANSNSPFCPSAFFSRGYLISSLICAFFSSANLSKNSDSESFSYRVIRLCLICIHIPQFGWLIKWINFRSTQYC